MQVRQDKGSIFVFDLGGVLIKWHSNDPIYRYIADRYDVPFVALRRALVHDLDRVESGEISTGAFIEGGLSKVGRSMRRGDSGEELWLRPFARSASLRLGVARIIASLRRQGYPVYGLSNISPPHLAFVRRKGWAGLYDRFFASCELGYVKPQPEAFEKVMAATGASPDRVTFIDDNPICIRGAKDVGIRRAFTYQSIPLLVKAIAR